MAVKTHHKPGALLGLITALVLLFNACVPSASVVQTPSADKKGVSDAATFQSKALPTAPPVYYEPPTLPEPQAGDQPQPKVPPKEYTSDEYEFNLEVSPGVLQPGEVGTFQVTLRNHSDTDLYLLDYIDKLEPGLEYVADAASPVSYDASRDEVRHTITRLAAGGEYSFEYRLRVTGVGSAFSKGELWVHTAELQAQAGDFALKTHAALGFDLEAGLEAGDITLIDPEGAWNQAGEVSVFIPSVAVEPNSILLVAPTRVEGQGPQLQFKVETFGTSFVGVDSAGAPAEGRAPIKSQRSEPFVEPVYMQVKLDSFADLKEIPAGQEAYVATYDEELDIWVKVPILVTDYETNTVTVETQHFSIWGAGLGYSLPQNGANVLLFNQPYVSLFTGASTYNIPVWSPPGRAGMAPYVGLSYSSGIMNGLLGDVQASWVGAGWNMDNIEVVRVITTDENGYGYVNDFALTLNGTLYDLTEDTQNAGRYYTDQDAFLYIERHNYALGNEQLNGVSPPNESGEWWTVVTGDGTRYRLGWNADAEQLALMNGYACTAGGLNCQTPDGAYASLGYAGIANDLVALRLARGPHHGYARQLYRVQLFRGPAEPGHRHRGL